MVVGHSCAIVSREIFDPYVPDTIVVLGWINIRNSIVGGGQAKGFPATFRVPIEQALRLARSNVNGKKMSLVRIVNLAFGPFQQSWRLVLRRDPINDLGLVVYLT